MGNLILKDQDRIITVFNIEKDVTFIGRLASINDIVLKDPYVSRQHALIKIKDNAHIIYDFNSSAGVFVNGEKISMHNLADGDQITLGHTTLVYRERDDVTAITEMTEIEDETMIIKGKKDSA
ncbi:MAG: FHA domain-containing protein [Pseudomonadota bacterium]